MAPESPITAPFTLTGPGEIVFGSGTGKSLAARAAGLGRRVLLFRGSSGGRTADLLEELRGNRCEVLEFTVAREPELEQAREFAASARGFAAGVGLAVGGGSVLDMGKAVCALAANPGDVLDHIEVVGAGRPLVNRPIPMIAAPTTAGTGSEATRNAVLQSRAHGVKASLRSPWMLPAVALVDPLLTLPLPRHLTAQTGMDALTQLIEPLLCRRANRLTDALCMNAIPRAMRWLEVACDEPENLRAREEMAWASLCGGLALANAGLGAVHGFAAALGGMGSMPHGAVCAALLPHVYRANWEEAKRGAGGELESRFRESAKLICGEPEPEFAAGRLLELIVTLEIPTLSGLGLARSRLEEVASKAAKASSMKANPVDLSHEQLVEILELAWQQAK